MIKEHYEVSRFQSTGGVGYVECWICRDTPEWPCFKSSYEFQGPQGLTDKGMDTKVNVCTKCIQLYASKPNKGMTFIVDHALMTVLPKWRFWNGVPPFNDNGTARNWYISPLD